MIYNTTTPEEVELFLLEAEKYIPFGHYCYKGTGEINPETHGRIIISCPFWDYDDERGEQSCGYCHLLKKGDWEDEVFGLLWDQVKSCNVNMDEDGITIPELLNIKKHENLKKGLVYQQNLELTKKNKPDPDPVEEQKERKKKDKDTIGM